MRAVSSAGLEQGTSNSQVGGSSPPRLAIHEQMSMGHKSAQNGRFSCSPLSMAFLQTARFCRNLLKNWSSAKNREIIISTVGYPRTDSQYSVERPTVHAPQGRGSKHKHVEVGTEVLPRLCSPRRSATRGRRRSPHQGVCHELGRAQAPVRICLRQPSFH